MLEILSAGGWLMVPLLLCSVLAVAIVLERAWALRRARVLPPSLLATIWHWHATEAINASRVQSLREGSPLGQVLAAGLANRDEHREVIKENIEEAGRHVVLGLERYLNTLGTVAAITPLLGLLGTVVGMIKVFTAITVEGVGNPEALAGGISEALISTAMGLSIAIPALIFYRYFRGRVDQFAVEMEQGALKMVEVLKGERQPDAEEGAPT